MTNKFDKVGSWVAVYRFADGALTTDSSGKGNTLTNSGVTYNGGADFESTESDYFDITDASLSSGFPGKSGTTNTDLVIGASFKLESLPASGNAYIIASKWSWTDNKRSFFIWQLNDGGAYRIECQIGYNGGANGETILIYNSSLTIGVRYYLGFSFDDSSKAYYAKIINQDTGAAVAEVSGTTTNNLSVDSGPFAIGCMADSGGYYYYFDGIIYELAISNTPKTELDFDRLAAGTYGATWSDWNVYVDWNNDGDFVDADEDISAFIQSIDYRRGKDGSSSLTRRSSSLSFAIKLFNTDGRFNSFLTTGPYYGNLLPGRKVKITSTYDGVTTTQLVGFIESIEPEESLFDLDTCTITGIGPIGYIQNKNVTVPIQQNVDTGVIVGALLDAISWPAGDRVIDTGATLVPMFYIPDERNILSVIEELEVSEGGCLYETKDGKLGWEARTRRLAGDYLTSQATFTDSGEIILGYAEISQADPINGVYNKASATVSTSALYALQVLWTSGETGDYSPAIAAGGSKEYWTTTDVDVIAVQSWTTPAATTDFLANAAANGSGTNLTANITVAVSKFSTSMKITLTNTSASTAYITFLQARGVACVNLSNTIVRASDATSQTKYGIREYPLDNKWIGSTKAAQLCVNAVVAAYKDIKPQIIISYNAVRSVAQITEALTRDFGHRITLVATGLGINQDFFVDAIAVSISESGFNHRVSYDLLPVTNYAATWAADDAVTVTPSTISDEIGQGWNQTCAFTITDLNTIAWGSGTLKLANGTSYSISAGNTGNMAARTYIYFDTSISTTAYQTTTTATSAAGLGRALIASAINGAVEPSYTVFGGSGETNIPGTSIVTASVTGSEIASNTITAANIAATTITASEIAANTITASQIAANTITASQIAANTITASQIAANTITASQIAAATITGTQIAATAIDAMTITGAIIRTAASGTGLYMDSTYGLRGFNSTTLTSRIDLDGKIYCDAIRGMESYGKGGYTGFEFFDDTATLIKAYVAGVSKFTFGSTQNISAQTLDISSGHLKVGGIKVVGTQTAHIDLGSGVTLHQDVEARVAIAYIFSCLESHGLQAAS
jgi:hypothetical protein